MEYEANSSPEAKFVKDLDKVCGLFCYSLSDLPLRLEINVWLFLIASFTTLCALPIINALCIHSILFVQSNVWYIQFIGKNKGEDVITWWCCSESSDFFFCFFVFFSLFLVSFVVIKIKVWNMLLSSPRCCDGLHLGHNTFTGHNLQIRRQNNNKK